MWPVMATGQQQQSQVVKRVKQTNTILSFYKGCQSVPDSASGLEIVQDLEFLNLVTFYKMYLMTYGIDKLYCVYRFNLMAVKII